MHFTHTPAAEYPRSTLPTGVHHSWTDVIFEDSPWRAERIRSHYRTMRRAGLRPDQVRLILWDVATAAIDSGARTGDHDLRYN